MSKPLVIKPFNFKEDVLTDNENSVTDTKVIQMERDQLVQDIIKKLEDNEYTNLKDEIEEVRKIEEKINSSKNKGQDLFSQLKRIKSVTIS